MTRIHTYSTDCDADLHSRHVFVFLILFPVLWHGSSHFSSPTQHTNSARHRKWVKTHSDHRSSDLPCEWLQSRKWLICLMVQKQEQWSEGENWVKEEVWRVETCKTVQGACKWGHCTPKYTKKDTDPVGNSSCSSDPLWPLTAHIHFNTTECDQFRLNSHHFSLTASLAYHLSSVSR